MDVTLSIQANQFLRNKNDNNCPVINLFLDDINKDFIIFKLIACSYCKYFEKQRYMYYEINGMIKIHYLMIIRDIS